MILPLYTLHGTVKSLGIGYVETMQNSAKNIIKCKFCIGRCNLSRQETLPVVVKLIPALIQPGKVTFPCL